MDRPRIAIPEIDQDVRNYTAALFEAGMEPVVISVQTEQIHRQYQQEYLDYSEFRVDRYDGLLLPGGGDIDPARYGEEDRGSRQIVEDLDQLQLEMIDAFVKEGKPVLGICRGLQIVNVYFGGTLIQDIPTAAKHAADEKNVDMVHGCKANEGSWLAKLYGTEFVHNSSHHQAADTPGNEIVFDSVCPEDGVVEALHHSRLPVYGVQWHPERMCLKYASDRYEDGLRIFRFFGEVCRTSMEMESDPAGRHVHETDPWIGQNM